MMSMNNLASAYRAAGRFPEALPLYAEALRLRRAALGPDHPDTLMSMNNLANFDRELGRYAEAIALQSEAMEKQRERLGSEHPDTLLSMSNLALAYQDAGRVSEAIPLLEETFRRRRDKLGPDHPETLVSMSNLATGYRRVGRLAEALPLLKETFERRRVTRGPGHPQTLRSANNLASAYLVTDPALAEPLLREALAIREKRLPDDWSTFEADSLLGAILVTQKKYAEAEQHLLRGHEGLTARAAKIPAPYRKVLAESARSDRPALRGVRAQGRGRGLAEATDPRGCRALRIYFSGSSRSSPIIRRYFSIRSWMNCCRRGTSLACAAWAFWNALTTAGASWNDSGGGLSRTLMAVIGWISQAVARTLCSPPGLVFSDSSMCSKSKSIQPVIWTHFPWMSRWMASVNQSSEPLLRWCTIRIRGVTSAMIPCVRSASGDRVRMMWVSRPDGCRSLQLQVSTEPS